MNTLELKGSLLDLIAKVNDPSRLARLFEAYNEIFVNEKSDLLNELSVEQQTRLSQTGETLEKIKPKKNNMARFKGLLTADEAEHYHTYLKQARNEWERDI